MNKQEYDLVPNIAELSDMEISDVEIDPKDGEGSIRVQQKVHRLKNNHFADRKVKLERIAASGQLRDCKRYDYFIILPDERFFIYWNLLMLMLYMVSYIMIPYALAFFDRENVGWIITDSIIDFIFLINIVLTFFEAYYDREYILIDKRKDIALHYLEFWFWVDLAATIPLYAFIDMKDYNALFRMLRLTKFPNGINLNRILKDKWIKLKMQTNKLIVLSVSFVIFCHILT